MIITFASAKGGAGKTTLAGCLGDFYCKEGFKVGFVDTDNEKNLTEWIAARDGDAFDRASVIHLDDETKVLEATTQLEKDNDIVIIDVAGALTAGLLYAIAKADLTIIPFQPSAGDVRSCLHTVNEAKKAFEKIGKSKPLACVSMRVDKRQMVYIHARNQIRINQLDIIGPPIGDRTIFKKAQFGGTTPLRAEARGKSANEIRLLARAIDKFLEKKIGLAPLLRTSDSTKEAA